MGKGIDPKTIPSEITYPPDGEMARKVVTRGPHHPVYKFASQKCRAMLETDSGIEYKRAILLEANPNVVEFRPQPFVLKYGAGGKIHEIYPDTLVRERSGLFVIEEDKPAKLAELDEWKERFELEEKLLAKHGYGFRLIRDVDVESGRSLKNAMKLMPYRRIKINSLLREAVKSLVAGKQKSGEEILRDVSGLTVPQLLAMAIQGHVFFDLEQKIEMSSIFSAVLD